MDSSTLSRAIQSLCRLDTAGRLEEYQLAVAEACRGPADDLERHIEHKWAIYKFARIASRLFGATERESQQAAMEAILPSTRSSIALDILDQFEQQLDEEELKAQAARSVHQFNRRAKRA
jgi:hypothetical protein